MPDVIEAGDLLWPLLSACGDDGPDGVDADDWATAQAVAIDWVWALSGRKFGTWDVVFRPEWSIPVARAPRNYVLGEGDGRRPYPVGAFLTGKPLYSVPLPGPVVSVEAVLVDGATLASSAYEVIGDQLVRLDGSSWYRYQNTTLPTTDVGTWQISYTRGVAVPTGGQRAAGVLACEQAKRISGDKSCRLPNNTTSVTRNGTTVSLDAKQPQQGFTTLAEVDQWCRLVNPNGRQSAPQVWSPDLYPNLLRPIPSNV